MGKIIRRIIAGLLIITALILIFIPSGDVDATTSKGDFILDGSTLVKYTGSDSAVSLPNTITAIGEDSFSKNLNLTKVVIPDSVKSIGYNAFEGCSNLSVAELGSGIKSIGSSAFSGCVNLVSVNVPEKCEKIGSGVFAECTSLSNVFIDPYNRYYVCADGVIYSKNGKELVQYLPGRTSSTYSMPSSVNKIGEYSFWGADSLTAVSVSNGVSEIPEYAFSNCNSLNKVSLPQSVESLMAFSFADCPSLKSIYIPDSVGYIDEKAFYLTNGAVIQFVAPNGTTTNSVAVSDLNGDTDSKSNDDSSSDDSTSADDEGDDSNLAVNDYFDDGYTPSYSGDTNWVTRIKNRDFNDNKLANELGSGKIVGGNAMFIMPSDMPVRGYNLTDAEDEDMIAASGGNTSLRNDLFSVIDGCLAKYNGSDSDVTIPESVSTVGERAFYKDSSLENVSIPSTVVRLDDFSFARSNLKNIDIPNSVTDIGYAAFYHCENLSDIGIPNSVSNIELGAFDGTAWLNNWKNGDSGDDYLVVGDGILVGYKGDGGNISLPSSVKQIGAGCFEGNNDITGVVIHIGINKIGEDAFNGCTKLSQVTFPDGLEVIEDRAFCDTNLSVVKIPDSVREIGLGAFDTTGNMNPLKTVIFSGRNFPDVSFKDTATRLSARDLRVDAFNGVENVIIQADADYSSGNILDPKAYGFHGQVYCISDDSNDVQGTLSLVKTSKKPDNNGVVSIDSHVQIGNEQYLMNGVKEHAFDDYLNYYEWCDTKPTSVSVSGNSSDELNALLSQINSSISSDISDNKGIMVSLDGADIGGYGEGYASIPGVDDSMILNISQKESNSDAILSSLYNYYGPDVNVQMLPLDMSMYDKSGKIPLHKFGDSKMEVSIPLPQKFVNQPSVKVASLDDNGSLTELSTSISKKNDIDYLNFVANHCSIYAIYVKNETTMVSAIDDSNQNEEEISGDDNPRKGRDEVTDDNVVEITTVINSDDSSLDYSQTGVIKTLSKTVKSLSAKWFVIIILFCMSFILLLYKPSKKVK